MGKIYNITILRPGGNDTALIAGIPPKEKRKGINDLIMKQYPNVEQVGFYTYDREANKGRLEMAGGEFCGNATRSLAYLLLNKKKGKLSIKVSGTKQLLQAGSKKKNTAYAQMPIISSFDSVEKISTNLFKVTIEGITHLIKENSKKLSKKQLKDVAKKLLVKYDLLLSVPASGVMFINQKDTIITSEPIVWVRDIQTLFYETACASGTTAIGLWKSLQTDEKTLRLNVLQPSKQSISIVVEKNTNSFKNAFIDGPITILNKTEVCL